MARAAAAFLSTTRSWSPPTTSFTTTWTPLFVPPWQPLFNSALACHALLPDHVLLLTHGTGAEQEQDDGHGQVGDTEGKDLTTTAKKKRKRKEKKLKIDQETCIPPEEYKKWLQDAEAKVFLIPLCLLWARWCLLCRDTSHACVNLLAFAAAHTERTPGRN